MKDKSIVFISAYSRENMKLAEQLCANKSSIACFWRNQDLDDAKTDFMSVTTGVGEDFEDRFFVISSCPTSETFFTELLDTIGKPAFQPDLIVVRGEPTDLWVFPIIKHEFYQNKPF